LLWPLLAACALIVSFATIVHGQSENPVVATVNGRSITQKEVDHLAMAQTLPLEQKLYAIRKVTLENLIILTVLESEANKRGLTVGELRKQLATGDVQVSPQQVEDAYAANASFFGNMSPDEVKERLRLDLETQQRMQNYRNGLAKLRKSANISLRLREPQRPADRDETMAPSIGPPDAPVTIVEFSDFECTYCRGVQRTIKQLLRTYGKHIKLVFKHLPLEIHPFAFPAAQAAFCAGQQGQFWQYHEALFNTPALAVESFKKIAENLGLEIHEFNRCLNSAASRNAISLNVREASQLGINSTPTFLINGKIVSGALDFEAFETIIERELRTARTSGNQ
jgi:predicted DsbA family dithiol-disulfide isomerase